MLLSIGKAIYLNFFLKSLDITENKDICMFVGFTVMDKGLFCQEITFFVSLLLDLVQTCQRLFGNLPIQFTHGSQESKPESPNTFENLNNYAWDKYRVYIW